MGVKYTISPADNGGQVLYRGSLLMGQVGIDDNCYTAGRCYTITTTSGSNAEDVLFVMCGMIGVAGLPPTSFCVTDSGCVFDQSSGGGGGDGNDDGAGGSGGGGGASNDDDFVSTTHTARPSKLYTPAPSSLPNLPKTSADKVWVFPTTLNITLSLTTTAAAGAVPSSTDLLFVSFALRHVFELANIHIWDVSSTASSSPSLLSSLNIEHRLQQHRVLVDSLSGSILPSQQQLSCMTTLSLVVESSSGGVLNPNALLDIESHTLSFALSSGLLQRLLYQALRAQHASGHSLQITALLKVLSADIHHIEAPMLLDSASQPAVADGYSGIWGAAGSSSGFRPQQSLPVWVIAVVSVVATLVAISGCVCLYWCFCRRQVRYDKLLVSERIDETDGEAYEERSEDVEERDPGASPFARRHQGRKTRSSDDGTVNIVFNQPMLHELPQQLSL